MEKQEGKERRICNCNPRIMKRKAVFLDKDGTIVHDVPYNVDPSKVVYQDGVFESMRLFQEHGFLLVIVTNQSGVARGLFDELAVELMRAKIESDLWQVGITLNGFYFCPHYLCGNVDKYSVSCLCRKPEPGMLLQAASELDIDLSASWMIGDILNDVEAGNRAGCNTVLLNNGNETEWLPGPYRYPDFTVNTLLQAAEIILKPQPVLK
jgi:D-glycero-D-manno-heptose 1,7-bisphosphate phosphatase